MGKRIDGAKAAFDKFLPKYSRIPLLLVIIVDVLAYFIPGLFLDGSNAYDLSVGLDMQIPLVTPFILFYVGAYVQWVVSYIKIGRRDREYCYRIVTANLISKVFCFLFFVLLPTTIARPEIAGGSVFDWLTQGIYSLDSPINLFPSIHCLESWVALRCAFTMKKVGWIYRAAMIFISVGVFMSVVFLRQHYLVDIPAGILVFELSLLLTRCFKLDKLFDRGMKFIKR